MPQPTTTPKIEELRAKLKADPKSRQFFPLAEELRKIDRFDDAEKVLRDGLTNHPTYLSAWISLGRVLHEATKYKEAVEVLEKALTLDQGNVVAARLLAESYLALGEKVEAIKKYKLLNALLPNDEETEAHIEKLDRELNPAKYGTVAPPPATAPVATPAPPPPSSAAPTSAPVAAPAPTPAAAAPAPAPAQPQPPPAVPSAVDDDDVFSQSVVTKPQELLRTPEGEDLFSGSEAPAPEAPTPARPSPEETSPFAPAPKFEPPPESAENLWSEPSTPQQPEDTGSPFDDLPPAPESKPAFELAEPIPFTAPPPVAAPPLAPEPVPAPPKEDLFTTVTMADLYAKQGHYDQAREIYQRMLEKDPDNRELRQKLAALPGATPVAAPPPSTEGTRNQAVTRLETWLSKVKKDGGRV